ncbi:hypothetical protein FRB97_000567, partial [Tulasnella sp. 331]
MPDTGIITGLIAPTEIAEDERDILGSFSFSEDPDHHTIVHRRETPEIVLLEASRRECATEGIIRRRKEAQDLARVTGQ